MKKIIVFLAGGMLFVCALCGADSYNVAEAISAASAAGNLGTYTDALGGEWRFGTVESNDVATITSFEATFAENSCNGYRDSGSLPFLVANHSGYAQNCQGVTLGDGYAVMHPNNVDQSHPCVAMELTVAKASAYIANIYVADGNGGGGADHNDGILFCVYVGGKLSHVRQISGELGMWSASEELPLELDPDTPVTFVVNPNVEYSHDTTVVGITVYEDDGTYVDPDDPVFTRYSDAVCTNDMSQTRSFRINESGIYDFSMLITHLEYAQGASGSDELVAFYRNGVKDLAGYCETGETVKRFALGDWYEKGDLISYEINPQVLTSVPRCRAILTEVRRQKSAPLVDVNALYYEAVRTENGTLPYTKHIDGIGDVVLTAGIAGNGGTWHHESSWFSSSRYTYPAPGSYTGFSDQSGFPWVLINDSAAMGPVNDAFLTEPVREGEIVIHPNASTDNVFVKATFPSNAYVRLVMAVRDLMKGGESGVKGYATADWNASTDPGWWSGGASGECFLNSGHLANVIVADKMDFSSATAAACFSIDAQSSHSCDTTAVKAWIFADDSVGTGDNVINIDIDGQQAGDPPPVTYAGIGHDLTLGKYWNGYHHMEKTENSFTISNLKTATGKDTSIEISFATTDGSMIGFDNNGSSGATQEYQKFTLDYMYLYGQTVSTTISGLDPTHVYDIYVYGTNAGHGYATFGGLPSLNDGAGANFVSSALNCAAMRFAGLKPDSSGAIAGEIAGDEFAGVFPGMQIVDVTPPREKLPLAIFIR